MARAISSKKWLYPPFIVAVLIFVTSLLIPPRTYYFIIHSGRRAPQQEYNPTASINYDGYKLQKQIDQMRTGFEKFLKRKIDEMSSQNSDRVMHSNTKNLYQRKISICGKIRLIRMRVI